VKKSQRDDPVPVPNHNNSRVNIVTPDDQPIHDWYRFVLAYPPYLVRDYLDKFGIEPGQTVLDPFCGIGTTLVECQKHGIASIGIEANPMAHFASSVKVDWSPDPDALREHVDRVAALVQATLSDTGIDDNQIVDTLPNLLHRLPAQTQKLLLTGSISEIPLHKALVLLQQLETSQDKRFYRHERLALAKAAVHSFSNLRFGPEVGVGKCKADAPVITPWQANLSQMADDLAAQPNQSSPAQVHLADARDSFDMLAQHSIDAVITSPPYPNEKDYSRITRLESVLLGFVKDRAELQSYKRTFVRSNTRNVYKGDSDGVWVDAYPSIQQLAQTIETRRLELGKTSGFEKLYSKVTLHYFGGMARHLAELRDRLRPNAQLAYVVGDQASYFRVMIRTAHLLAEIAERLGYEVVDIELFRTRLATATKKQLREEVLILRWPGSVG
jgi:hypothetical protein